MKVPYVFGRDGTSLEINVKEHVMWRNEVTVGKVHIDVIETQIITNLRVLQNNSSYFLHNLDDVLVMNHHKESQYRPQRSDSSRLAISYNKDMTTTVGDVVFIHQCKPVIVFKQIVDPFGVCILAKTVRGNLISHLKSAEKQYYDN